jgi:hypothetical protein
VSYLEVAARRAYQPGHDDEKELPIVGKARAIIHSRWRASHDMLQAYTRSSSSRGCLEIELILNTYEQMGYRIHEALVFRGILSFLAPWAASGTYTNGKI